MAWLFRLVNLSRQTAAPAILIRTYPHRVRYSLLRAETLKIASFKEERDELRLEFRQLRQQNQDLQASMEAARAEAQREASLLGLLGSLGSFDARETQRPHHPVPSHRR